MRGLTKIKLLRKKDTSLYNLQQHNTLWKLSKLTTSKQLGLSGIPERAKMALEKPRPHCLMLYTLTPVFPTEARKIFTVKKMRRIGRACGEMSKRAKVDCLSRLLQER